MSTVLETYKLDDIVVEIHETDTPGRIEIVARKGEVERRMKARYFDYKNYTRLTNRRIASWFEEPTPD